MPYEGGIALGLSKGHMSFKRVQSQSFSSFSKRQRLEGRMQYLQQRHILPIVLCSTAMFSNLKQNICQLGTSVQPSWYGREKPNPLHRIALGLYN